jgi:hypothetical protein
VELGIEGLIAHVLIYVGILVTSFKVARHALTVNRRLLGTVVFFCTIGIMINAMTGVVFNAPVLTYLYFWFAGSVVSISQMESVPKAARQPAQRLELSAA